MFALAEQTAYVAVGVLSLIGVVVAGYFANRTRQQIAKVELSQRQTDSAITVQGSLIDDLREDRADLRKQYDILRAEFHTMKQAHEECEIERADLLARVAHLEEGP